MSNLEGYMSDLELESRMKDFFNYQPGAAFMKYLFSAQRLANLYEEYTIAIEDGDKEKEMELRQYIIDIVEDVTGGQN